MTPRTPVQALLFDLGGVVIDIDFERAFAHWQQESRLSLQQLRREFSMDGPYRQHERGEISQAAYFDHLRELLKLTGSDEDIARGWNAIFIGTIGESLDCVMSIKGRIPSFAFTNSNPTHQAAWTHAFPDVVTAFDQIFVSSDLGLRKPEREAFEAVAQAAGVSLPDTLFFDDTLENIEGARGAGLQTVHVRGPQDLRQALAAAGLL